MTDYLPISDDRLSVMDDISKVVPFSLPAQKRRRTRGSTVVLHASVGLCIDFEQDQKFAEPDVIHSQAELKSAINTMS